MRRWLLVCAVLASHVVATDSVDPTIAGVQTRDCVKKCARTRSNDYDTAATYPGVCAAGSKECPSSSHCCADGPDQDWAGCIHSACTDPAVSGLVDRFLNQCCPAAGAPGVCNADGSRPNGGGGDVNAVPTAVSNAPTTEACFATVQQQTGKAWQQVCKGSYADWQAFHGKMLDCYGSTSNGKPTALFEQWTQQCCPANGQSNNMCPGAVVGGEGGGGTATATATPKPDPTGGGGYVPPPAGTCPTEAPRCPVCPQSCVGANLDKCPGPTDCVIADGSCLSAWEATFAAEYNTTRACVFDSSLGVPNWPLGIASLVLSAALATLVLVHVV